MYDSTGHLLREFAYDENHCMTLHRQPGGEGYYYQWGWYEGPDDAAWRVTGHHTDSGEQYRLAWDLAQRRLCVTDGLGRTRYHQWDAQNQVTAYQDEAGQVTTFRWSDEERLLLGMTDPQGGKWRYVYDLQGHITETHDPLGRVEQAQWHPVWHQPETEVDAAGNLLGRRAGERATAENSVVPFNRLMSYRGVHYRYDEFGRAVEKEGRSGTQSYRYDAEHRMVEVTTARGHTGMCTMHWGGGRKNSTSALTVSRTTGQNFYGTECGWRRRAGRREQAACTSTGTRGVMNRWRGWIRRAKRARTGYCIFTRM